MSSSSSLRYKIARCTFADDAKDFAGYSDVANFRRAADTEAAWLARVKHVPYLGLLRESAGLDTPFSRTPEYRAYVGNLLDGSWAGLADRDYRDVDLSCCALPRLLLERRWHETVNTRTPPPMGLSQVGGSLHLGRPDAWDRCHALRKAYAAVGDPPGLRLKEVDAERDSRRSTPTFAVSTRLSTSTSERTAEARG